VHTCSRNGEELNKCLHEWKDKKLKVSGSICDVSSRAEREKLIETVKSDFQGRLTILVSLSIRLHYAHCSSNFAPFISVLKFLAYIGK
jgi:NAD(P)-dependent dehydrogenase (short-subunit alcohol dehydrogenase family)